LEGIWKETVETQFEKTLWLSPDGTKESHKKTLSHDSRSLNRDLNPEPPEFEATGREFGHVSSCI
jgi:hypothetical protein